MPPPFQITREILTRCAAVMRKVGQYEGLRAPVPQPLLRRKNRIRTVHGSLAIEGNALTEQQVTAVLDGKRVTGSPHDLREAENAVTAYQTAGAWSAGSMRHLLTAHRTLMAGLISDAGRWRQGGVGVFRVEHLVAQLLKFVRNDAAPWLVKAAVVHCEIQFIHPFSNGNGRTGRLWQHVALRQVSPVFAHVPVESIIRREQRAYYRVLKACDLAGDSTQFIEMSLAWLEESLGETLAAVRPERAEKTPRLELARQPLGEREFSRKDYLALFPGLSTASASRDLAGGVEAKALRRVGERASSRYRFR